MTSLRRALTLSRDLRLFDGHFVPDVSIFGQVAHFWIDPLESEMERRLRCGLEPITDANAIRSLMGLPLGVPISDGCVHPIDLLSLDQIGPGAVEYSHLGIVRHAVPPITLLGCVKLADGWEDIQAATLLRTHVPRVVIAPRRLARRALRDIDPDVGIAIMTPKDIEVIRDPGSRWLRPSWQRWLISEKVFARWLESKVSSEV